MTGLYAPRGLDRFAFLDCRYTTLSRGSDPVWAGQAYTCIWVGRVALDAADPEGLGPVNVTIRRAGGLTLDGCICSQP
jgi:hypothetical protein